MKRFLTALLLCLQLPNCQLPVNLPAVPEKAAAPEKAASRKSTTARLQAQLDAAVASGKTWEPEGTYVLDAGPLWVDVEKTSISGRDFKLTTYPVAGPGLIVGLPRTPGGIGIDPATDTFALSEWVPGSTRRGLDFDRGNRTMSDLVTPLKGHMVFAGTTLDTRNWASIRQLTVEMAMSDIGAGPWVGFIDPFGAPQPWEVGGHEDWLAIAVKLEGVGSITWGFARPPPPDPLPLYYAATFQVNLDTGVGKCWIGNGPGEPGIELVSYGVPPGLATPYPALMDDYRNQLLVNAGGTYGGAYPWSDGTVRPCRFGGLRISKTDRYASNGSGHQILKAGGEAIDPIADLWTNDANTLAVLPLNETDAQLQNRVILVDDPTIGGSMVALYLGNEHATWNSFINGVSIEGAEVESATSALLLGTPIDLSIRNSKLVGMKGWGIGKMGGNVTYTTRLNRLILRGGDAAMNLRGDSVRASEIDIPHMSENSDTFRLDDSHLEMDNCFTAGSGTPRSWLYARMSTVRINNAQINLEGGDCLDAQVVFIGETNGNSVRSALRLDGFAAGVHSNARPVIRIGGTGATYINISNFYALIHSAWPEMALVENPNAFGVFDVRPCNPSAVPALVYDPPVEGPGPIEVIAPPW